MYMFFNDWLIFSHYAEMRKGPIDSKTATFHRETRWKLILCFVHEIHIFLFRQNSASSYILFMHVMDY